MSGTKARQVSWISVMVGLAGAALTAACNPNPFVETVGLRECPHAWRSFTVVDPDKRQTVVVTPSGGLALSRVQTDIPEFNDCQRFVVGTGYGPLFAIFAAYRLDSVVLELDSVGMEQDSASTTIGKRAMPVAVIFNQGPETYVPLDVRPGFSCLRLFYVGKKIHARLEHLGANQEACTGPLEGTIPPGTPLEVREVKFVGFVKHHFPPVARWDWDPVNQQQYIGILCGEKWWCEVGRQNFASSPADLHGSSRIDKEARVRRIKGWYDEQQMDVMVGATLTPSTVHAAVIPDPDLKDHTLASYQNTWIRTGYIALDALIPAYLTKLNISQVAPGSALNRMNTIDMCFGTHAACNVDRTTLHFNSTCTAAIWNAAATERWWARIQAANALGSGRYKYFCVIRRTHPTLPMGVPGTARWRWLDDDPSVWEACADGCCELQARRL